MQRLLLFLCFMAIGSGMVYLLTVGESPPRKFIVSDIPANVLSMKGVVVRQHESAGMKLEIIARSAIYYERLGESEMRVVKFNIFGDNGDGWKRQIFGTSDIALTSRSKDTVVLVGRVRITNADGTVIHSERIIYDQLKDLAVSPGAVKVESQGAIHHGSSLVYDIRRDKMKFTAPVFYQNRSQN